MAPRGEVARAAGVSPQPRGTKRGRPLQREESDPKLPTPAKRSRGANVDAVLAGAAKATKQQEAAAKRAQAAAVSAAKVAEAEAFLAAEAEKAEQAAQMERCGVAPLSHPLLAPLLKRWGPTRAAQVVGLWTFLGDGAHRPVSTPCLQVVGPGGTGKTALVRDFLSSLGIRHVYLNCAHHASLGDLFARLAELLRRAAVAASKEPGGAAAGDLPRELQQRSIAVGRQLRALDRFEAALKAPLEYLGRCSTSSGSSGPAKVIVVLDDSQALPQLAEGAAELVVSLSQVLQRGDQLTFVTVGRMPLSRVGLLEARNPPAVPFKPYSAAEAETILLEALRKQAAALPQPPAVDLPLLCGSGLMKFAAPFLGNNISELLQVGEQVLLSPPAAEPGVGAVAALQQKIDEVVQKRNGLCDLRGLLPAGEVAEDSATAAAKSCMLRMTKAEKRLLLAAYLACRISNQDDWQLFLPQGRRGIRKRGPVIRTRADDDQPPVARVPQPVILARLVSIYCRLARQPHLLSSLIYEHLRKLSEAGLLGVVGEGGSLDRDIKVTCHADLPLARACAGDLNIDLAEYLCTQ